MYSHQRQFRLQHTAHQSFYLSLLPRLAVANFPTLFSPQTSTGSPACPGMWTTLFPLSPRWLSQEETSSWSLQCFCDWTTCSVAEDELFCPPPPNRHGLHGPWTHPFTPAIICSLLHHWVPLPTR